MLLLKNEEDFVDKTNPQIRIGFVHVVERETDDVAHNLKMQSLKIIQKYKSVDWLSFEPIFHLKKIDKQFQYMNKKRFDVAIIIGETELKENKIQVKNLHSAEQITVSLNDNLESLVNFFKKK